MSEQRLTIHTEQDGNGNWILVDNGGNQEDYKFESRDEAMMACEKLWPTNSVWHGMKVDGGWSIVI